MTEFKLYIGANNETGEVEQDRIIEIVGERFDGFTVQPAVGVWKGKQEKSVVVTIIADHVMQAIVAVMVEILTRALKQEFILVTFHDINTNL